MSDDQEIDGGRAVDGFDLFLDRLMKNVAAQDDIRGFPWRWLSCHVDQNDLPSAET